MNGRLRFHNLASCIDWAQHRRRKAAAKLHVRLARKTHKKLAKRRLVL